MPPPPRLSFFFFNDTATTEIYTLSLHDALPICMADRGGGPDSPDDRPRPRRTVAAARPPSRSSRRSRRCDGSTRPRSEEHTSELQSRPHLVCRLLLEKKNFRFSFLCLFVSS